MVQCNAFAVRPQHIRGVVALQSYLTRSGSTVLHSYCDHPTVLLLITHYGGPAVGLLGLERSNRPLEKWRLLQNISLKVRRAL